MAETRKCCREFFVFSARYIQCILNIAMVACFTYAAYYMLCAGIAFQSQFDTTDSTYTWILTLNGETELPPSGEVQAIVYATTGVFAIFALFSMYPIFVEYITEKNQEKAFFRWSIVLLIVLIVETCSSSLLYYCNLEEMFYGSLVVFGFTTFTVGFNMLRGFGLLNLNCYQKQKQVIADTTRRSVSRRSTSFEYVTIRQDDVARALRGLRRSEFRPYD